MRDVAHVRDGFPAQTSVVHVDGARAVLSTIMKNGSASTLDVRAGVKDKLPLLREQLPDVHQDRRHHRPVGLRQGRHRGRGSAKAPSPPP